MIEMCRDNRFEIIERAKKHILEATNIDTSPDEMKVLDNFLFRCWQMGWLKNYEKSERLTDSKKTIPCLSEENQEYWLKVYFKLKEYEDREVVAK